MAMDSIPNNINKPAALQKTGIGKITEWIGFLETITIAAEINATLANALNKRVWISIESNKVAGFGARPGSKGIPGKLIGIVPST